MANSDLRSYLSIMSNGESDRLSYVNNAAYEDNSLSVARLNNLLKRQNLTNRAKENITNYNEQLQKLKEQNRSGWQKFWDTLNEVSSNVWTGLFSGFDAIGDLGITIGSWFTDDDTWATNAKNYDWVSQASNAMTQFGQVTSGSDLFTGDIFQDNYADRWDTINSVQESQRQLQTLYDNSLLNYFGDGFHDFVKDLGTTIGQMAPAIGLSFIPGAGPALALGYMGLVAGGRELSDTYDETGDIWTSIKKGALSAGVEVATELLVGKGLAKLGVGTGKLFGIAGKGTSTAKQSISKTLAKSMFEEGTEEAVSGFVSPLVDALAYEDTSYLSQYGNKEFWYSGDESLVRQFALGAASAGVLGGGNAVINTSRYGVEGYKARLAYESIYEDYEDLKKINDRNSSRYRKAQEKLAQDSIDFIDFLDKTKAKSTNSSSAKAQYDNLIRDMTRGISNQISLDDRYERIVNQVNSDPNKQSANLLVNELNNMFQNDVKVQFVSEEELGSGNTASFDRATRTISINENYSDEFASKIAHEYIGHAVLENINSETRTKLLNDIKKTDYYKNNIEKIRQAYGDTDVLEEEIIANYIESELTSLNEINNTFLNKSILRKAINLFDKAFIRNTDKAVLDNIVAVTNKVGSISRINNKIALNVPLNKKERLFYNNHKDYFNYVRDMRPTLLYSKENMTKSFNKLKDFTDVEIKHLNSSLNKTLDTIDDVEKFIDDSIKGTVKQSNGLIGKIPDDVAKRILKDTGYHVDGFALNYNKSYIVHTFERHVLNQANSIPIKKSDFLLFPKIVLEYDSAQNIKDFNGNNAILFQKKVGDKFRLIGLISFKAKKITLESLYITQQIEKATIHHWDNANNLSTQPSTSKTVDGNSSPLIDSIIQQNSDESQGENVKQFLQKKDIKYSKKLEETNDQIVTIAPLRISNINNENFDETLNRVNKIFNDNAKIIADLMGITINETRLNIGGFESSEGRYKGQNVNEISYSFNLGKITEIEADRFACLLGDLGLEVQEAVISMNYEVDNSANANGMELEIVVNDTSDIDSLKELLIKNHLSNYTIDKTNNRILITGIFEFDNIEELSQNVDNLIGDLGENYVGYETNKINSRYLEREDRRSLYQAWLRSNAMGQQMENGERSRNLRSKIKQAIERLEEDLKLDNSFNSNTDNIKYSKSLPSTELDIESESEQVEIEPFETNKAKKIKDYANQRLGKVISLKDTSNVYNQIVDYIYANFGASVKNVNSKVRALFEEYNVVTDYSYNDFAKDLLNSEITNSELLIGENTDNYTLKDYLNEQGINPNELENDLALLLKQSLDSKGDISNVSRFINNLDKKLFKAVNRIQELKNYAKNYAKLSSKIKNLRDQLKLPNNFDIDIQDEASALKYLISGRVFTRNGGISGTYRTRLHKLLTEGYFDKIINNTNFNEFEDFGEAINIFKDLANTYDESRGNNQKILSVSEGEQLIAAYSKIVKTLQEYKNGVFSEIINVATRSANEQIIVNNAKRNLPFTNKLKGFVHKIINPLSVFGTEFGGKDSYLYKQTIQKAVDAYVNEQLDEATLQRKFNDTLTKKSILLKDQNKNVKFRNYDVPRYNLYALYLNANSINYEDLLEQGFILKGLRNKNEPHLDFNEEVLAEVNELLTSEEITELNKVSDFLNNELKEYVRKAQINDIGYSTMMDNGVYYPKFTDRGTLNKQLNDPNQPDFMIDASAWNSLKLRTGRKTRIELNNPISVVNSYITSASRYANLTNAQRTINRVFNKKFETPINGYSSLRDMIKQTSGSDLLMHLTSFMNKLQGNNVRRSSEFIDKWGGRFATATLGLNISSTLKQIGSLPTTANKTGILNQLKSLVNFDTYKIRENYNYLVEHNGLFAMRVLNHGYANSQVFLNEVSRVSNRTLNKLIDASQLPLEKADALWCVMSFGACKQQAFNEFNGKYSIDSEEVMTRANTLFNDILLETQSNAYAISTSMLRSGEMGSFARWIFGTFASDSQNKLSLLYESIYNYVNNNRVIQNLNNELNNNLDLSEDTKNTYRDMLNARINNKSKLSVAMYRNAYTLTASALLTFAASLLARWLLNKDKEEDYEVENLATNFAKELFIDWIPFISTISSNFEYNEGKFEAMPLENASRLLNDLYSMISSLTEGNGFNRTVLFTLIRDLAQFYGLPVTNFFNITNGVIEKFSPEVAFNMNNFLYGYSQSYIEKTQNDSLEKGYFKTGKLYLNQNITLFKTGELNSAIINELATLKNKGFNAIPKNYMTSYTDENGNEILLTDLEMNTFRSYYNEVNDEALILIRSSAYKTLDDEDKAKVLKKLFDYYYDYAKNMALEETEGSRLVKLMTLIDNFNISDYLLLKGETKEETLSNVNKIFSSRNEKLLALYLVGYNLTDENKEIVYRYLLSKGLTRSAAKDFMGIE